MFRTQEDDVLSIQIFALISGIYLRNNFMVQQGISGQHAGTVVLDLANHYLLKQDTPRIRNKSTRSLQDTKEAEVNR